MRFKLGEKGKIPMNWLLHLLIKYLVNVYIMSEAVPHSAVRAASKKNVVLSVKSLQLNREGR